MKKSIFAAILLAFKLLAFAGENKENRTVYNEQQKNREKNGNNSFN